jgi:hypothetical protein
MALIQETQDEHYAQLQHELEPVMKVMKAKEIVELHNVMDLVKTRIEAGDERLAPL